MSTFQNATACPASGARDSGDALVPVPICATWYCTDRCTLRCCHCFVPIIPAAARAQELNTLEAKRMIDGLFDAEVFLLAFAGGEPMLRDDFFELSAYARQRGFTIQTSTNGLDLGEANVARLQEVGYQCVQISLDGLTEESNAWTRGPGNWQRTLTAIRTCRKRRLPVVLAVAVHQRNLHEAAQIAEFAEREEVEIVKVQPIFLPFRYPDSGRTGTLLKSQVAELQVVLDETFAGRKVQLKNNLPASSLTDEGALQSGICCRRLETPTIFPDGSLSPCFNGRSIAQGNLSHDDFIPTWNAAVNTVLQRGSCGCSQLDIDVLRPALRRGPRCPSLDA
ncbi:MAG: radical SAM protein [Deltaproteobacteria bacterium]